MESELKLIKMGIVTLNGNTETNSVEPNKLSKKAAFIQIFTAMMANLSVLSPGKKNIKALNLLVKLFILINC